jgi:hypothetical protein
VLGKMSLLDEGNKSTARLGELASELDVQLTRVGARLHFVEKLDERVNGLHVVTTDVERKLAEQLERRAEIESLKNLCERWDTGRRAKARRRGCLRGFAADHAQVRRCCRRSEKSRRLVDRYQTRPSCASSRHVCRARRAGQGPGRRDG